MSNFLTNDTKAILLLCGIFTKDHSVKPLLQSEYNAVVRWLMSAEKRPEDLLNNEILHEVAIGSGIEWKRLEMLISRGVQLGFSVEEWQNNGIWIISRSDEDYPARFKKHLKDQAPPLLFGVGDRTLLVGGGLAIVGSRNVDEEGEQFTRNTAEICAFNKMTIVSGGARGVDMLAMSTALEVGGVTIGVLADNLLRMSIMRDSRKAINDGRLLLISPYHPKAGFHVGTAMSRNKLIYAMADYGLVVSADYKKGGTWAGATEELKRENSLSVFVRTGGNVPSGNNNLFKMGALEWPVSVWNDNLVQQLNELSSKDQKQKNQKELTLFDAIDSNSEKNETSNIIVCKDSKISKDTIYERVLPLILNQVELPIGIKELSEKLDVTTSQLSIWLKIAVKEKRIVKLSRPVRYQLNKAD